MLVWIVPIVLLPAGVCLAPSLGPRWPRSGGDGASCPCRGPAFDAFGPSIACHAISSAGSWPVACRPCSPTWYACLLRSGKLPGWVSRCVLLSCLCRHLMIEVAASHNGRCSCEKKKQKNNSASYRQLAHSSNLAAVAPGTCQPFAT